MGYCRDFVNKFCKQKILATLASDLPITILSVRAASYLTILFFPLMSFNEVGVLGQWGF